MLNQLQTHTSIALLVLAGAALVGWILAIIALAANGRLRRKVRRWQDIHATSDLETVYNNTMGAVEELRRELGQLEEERLGAVHTELADIRRVLRTKVGTPTVYRYNAFSDVGSDLSFSVALLDDEQDGVVLSSIYGREESRTYAKPVERGASRYTLTGEERSVISQVASSVEPPEQNSRR